MNVLVTGGAGFIGSHVVSQLQERGRDVVVLDRLDPQTHGNRPPPIPEGVRFVHGDVRDPEAVRNAMEGVDQVVHLAAAVGVGQSMYEPARYVDENTRGTAVLWEQVVEQDVDRMVVASSMSIYGEGLYHDDSGQPARPTRRGASWDPVDAHGARLHPVPTPEEKEPDLASVYALTKYDQERMCLMMGKAYDVPTVALRFFNTYGPGQALQNPYTGVLAIFAARLLNGQPPMVFEDGKQLRDFVYVEDVAAACLRALEAGPAVGETINVGTGQPRSVLDVADALAAALGKDIGPEVTGKARTGDIRHCFADTRKARELLDFEARTRFSDGVRILTQWLEDKAPEDRVPHATRELEEKGLIR